MSPDATGTDGTGTDGTGSDGSGIDDNGTGADATGSWAAEHGGARGAGSGRALLVAWLLLGALAAVRAAPQVAYMARAFTADGPNTVGEAGKVWFAHRIQTGERAFASADEPPYYPSVHGALLHATVAWTAGLVDAPRGDLYGIGRWASVLMTALACLLLAALGRRLGIPPHVLAVGGLLWIGTFPLVQHTMSYRPDNWVLALSVLACWLLSVQEPAATVKGRTAAGRPPESRAGKAFPGTWHLLALVLLPAVAFHVKATGAVLVGAIGLVHLVRRQWSRAVLVGGAQTALIAGSVLALDALSDGAYSDGLRGAVSVPWDPGLVLLPHLFRLGDPLIPLFLLGPLPVVVWALRRPSGPDAWLASRAALVAVSCFWLVTLLGYGAATVRAGSAPYYLLEPASYGLVLVLYGIGLLPDAPRLRHVRWRGPLTVGLLAALAAGSTLDAVLRPHGVDIALMRTEHVGAHRAALADRVNAQDGVCYSDDPGLNILLRRPAVVYPLLQLQMIQSGALPPDALSGPVERHEYRCVIFSGLDWSYRGLRIMPPPFRTLVGREYPWVERVGPYAVHYPEGETLPPSR